MRLIDADALLEEMIKIGSTLLPDDTRTIREVTVFNSISGMIGNAPTVELQASNNTLREALEWIARVNACDYEYQRIAKEALKEVK